LPVATLALSGANEVVGNGSACIPQSADVAGCDCRRGEKGKGDECGLVLADGVRIGRVHGIHGRQQGLGMGREIQFQL
ncbi:MAG: hypothetical protein OSA88_13550, partial [Acidimicrobiales bacterium]|nr:hypothetical protein [Acidimicrobiales bacterium]